MEKQSNATETTWDDVVREMDAGVAGSMPDTARAGDHPHGGPDPHCHRHGGGRVTTYLLLVLLLNVLLAVYALYVVGLSMEYGWTAGGSGNLMTAAFRILLLASPLLLTILLNRLLFKLVRGRGRFPRGIALVSVLLVILTQALTIYVIFSAGGATQLTTFDIETITTTAG